MKRIAKASTILPGGKSISVGGIIVSNVRISISMLEESTPVISPIRDPNSTTERASVVNIVNS